MPTDPWVFGLISVVVAWLINRGYEAITDNSKKKASAQEEINKEVLGSLKAVQISLERVSLRLDHNEEIITEQRRKLEEHDRDIVLLKNRQDRDK